MAISVDTVYKTVLLILNKEQRGYMTPDEFNKIGSQVQREIFEAYFEDLNQQLRIPQSDVEYSDRVAITDEKIAEFKKQSAITASTSNVFPLPTDLYRLGSATYERSNRPIVEIQRVGRAEYYNIIKSPLTAPNFSYPIYLYEDNKLLIYPSNSSDKVAVQYVKKPDDIRWGYYTGSLGQLINDPTVYGDDLLNNNGSLLNSLSPNLDATAPTLASTIVTPNVTPGVTTTSTGAGLTINLAITLGSGITTLSVATPGTGYSINDQITFSSAIFGGAVDAVVTLSAADFNSGSTFGTIDFGLHNSERTEAILKILLYQGVVIRDPQIVQVAAQKVQQEEVNEKS